MEDSDEDEGETLLSTEDPNINYSDIDDDGMNVEDDGVRHCKSDPWRTNILMGSIHYIKYDSQKKQLYLQHIYDIIYRCHPPILHPSLS